MKKTRLIIGLLFAILLISALSLSVGAVYRIDNPFSDISADSWYYEQVQFCRENNLFTGTSESTFSPDTPMSRAMLVTVLASAHGYDKAEYSHASFDDVAENTWYYTAVCWAKENKIVSGISDTAFAPDALVTREQSAVILRKFAQYKNLDNGSFSSELTAFSDADSVSDWAVDSLKWATENSLISGTSKTTLSPKGTATRGAFAVMLRRLFALSPKITIAGNDISLYTIVIPEEAPECVAEAATDLQKYLAQATGITLPIKTDTESESDYEILLGKTCRTDLDLTELGKTQYMLTVKDGKMYICGKNDRTGARGTLYGVYFLLEKRLGTSFYNDSLIICDPDPIISLENGYTVVDGPVFETRIVYWEAGFSHVFYNDEYFRMYGLPHQLGNFIKDTEGEEHSRNPCLSNENNINALINNLRKRMKAHPECDSIHLVQNDEQTYCTCEKCMAAYREDGSRCATIIRACNAVSDALTPEFPNLEIFTWAYHFSIKPPKVTKPRENISLFFNSIIYCPSHAYSEEKCNTNESFYPYLDEWKTLVNNLYVWDHSTNFFHLLAPFAGLDEMRQNAADFYAHGVTGVFNNAIDTESGEFGELRAYLFTQLYRNPTMSEDEYNYHIRSFLKAYYGNGWESILTYLDLIEELTEDRCFGFNGDPSMEFDYDEVMTYEDEILRLWDEAEKGATDETQLYNVRKSELSARYLIQCARYDSRYTNGTEEERSKYMSDNEAFYNDVIEFGVQWSEQHSAPDRYTSNTPPSSWG